MAESYVCVRLEAISATAASRQFLHDTRERQPGYITGEPRILLLDRHGYHRSRCTGGTADEQAIKKLFWEIGQRKGEQRVSYRRAHGRRMHPRTRQFIRVLLCFSKCVNEIPLPDLVSAGEEFFLRLASQANLPFLYETLHLDEKTLHFHGLLENYDYDEQQTRFRRLGRRFFSDVQDWAAESFEHLGFRRGLPKALTQDNHRSPSNARRDEAILREAGEIVFRNMRRDLLRHTIIEDFCGSDLHTIAVSMKGAESLAE